VTTCPVTTTFLPTTTTPTTTSLITTTNFSPSTTTTTSTTNCFLQQQQIVPQQNDNNPQQKQQQQFLVNDNKSCVNVGIISPSSSSSLIGEKGLLVEPQQLSLNLTPQQTTILEEEVKPETSFPVNIFLDFIKLILYCTRDLAET